GDFFEPRYARAGFVPWVDFRKGNAYDPLLGYYRWANRDNPRWERDLRQLFVARSSGEAQRPARTFAQQTTLIQNLTKNNVTINNINNRTAIAPLAKMDRTVVKLQPVTKERQAEVRKHAEAVQTLMKQRSQGEIHLARPGAEAPAAEHKPPTLKLTVPKAPVAREAPKIAPPPRPAPPPAHPHPPPAAQ